MLTPDQQVGAILDIGNRDFFGRIATTDPSVTMCTAWPTPGPLTAAEVVWEFNQVEIARIPAQSIDGVIGTCIEQGGEPFGTGSYQTYIATVDTTSHRRRDLHCRARRSADHVRERQRCRALPDRLLADADELLLALRPRR